MAKVLEQSATIATYALVVDAKDVRAASFYARYDFIALPGNPLRLFLPVATIAQLFAEPERGSHYLDEPADRDSSRSFRQRTYWSGSTGSAASFSCSQN
jgi:hypothetical protein